MRYQSLSSEEEITIREMSNNYPNLHIRNRAQSILMSHNTISVKQIAAIFSVRTRTIYSWFDDYEQYGFIGLYTQKGQGRKATFSKLIIEQKTQIIDWVDEGESLKKIAGLVKEQFDLKVSKYMLKQFIKKKDIAGNASENG